MTYLKLYAPAKVNLFLRVVGKLPSGFHEIASLIAPITLHDDIELTLDFAEETWSIGQEYSPRLAEHVGYLKEHCKNVEMAEDGMRGNANLAFRAAVEFCKTFRNLPRFGGRIVIHKRIPFGAGMGGGSSDAAAVIRGLCWFFRIPLSHPQVHEIAGVLGSDVFALLDSRPCLVRGRGELVTPLYYTAGAPSNECGREASRLASSFVLILKPPLSVPTADAYRWLDSASVVPTGVPLKLPTESPNTLDLQCNTILSRWGFDIAPFSKPTDLMTGGVCCDVLASGNKANGSNVDLGFQGSCDRRRQVESEMCFNDIEQAVFQRIDVLRCARDYLLSTSANHVLLSGSGSAIFAIFATFNDVNSAEKFFVGDSSYRGWFMGIEKFFNLL